MNKKNDDAFLKSIIGTSPIKKNNKLKRKIEIPSIERKKNTIKKNTIDVPEVKIPRIQNKSFYKIEKTSINKKLKKGKVPIDIKIDFHGMALFDAEILFVQTITDCYKRNKRCILFVTGKGVLRKNNEEKIYEDTKLYYGKIRNNFFDWTKKSELQKQILSIEQAGLEYGGDGAFFVYLRKQNLNFN